MKYSILYQISDTINLKIVNAMKKHVRERYPENWPQISANIIYGRAGNRCEQCGIKNGAFRYKERLGPGMPVSSATQKTIEGALTVGDLQYWEVLRLYGVTRVILTCAHLNHNEQDNRPENLRAWCQSCHLKHDRENNRLRAKAYKLGQLSLNPEFQPYHKK